MNNSPRSITLHLQVPDALVQSKLYDYTDTDSDWWRDVVDMFFEDFEERTGLWHEAYSEDFKGRKHCAVEFELYNPRYVYFKCGVFNWTKFLATHKLEDKFPIVLRYHQYGQGHNIVFHTDTTGYGYRNACTFHLEYDDSYVSWQWNDGMDEAAKEMGDDWMNQEIKELLEFVENLIDSEFDRLLDDLDSEYEWLCSEEYVRQQIEDNWSDDEIIDWGLNNVSPPQLTWISQPYNLTA